MQCRFRKSVLTTVWELLYTKCSLLRRRTADRIKTLLTEKPAKCFNRFIRSNGISGAHRFMRQHEFGYDGIHS